MATLDRERLQNLYASEAYRDNTRDWEDAVAPFRAKAFYEALKIGGLAEGVRSILDVGCGSGGVLIELRLKYGSSIGGGKARFFGLDVSEKAISVANRLYPNAEELNVFFSHGLLDTEPEQRSYGVLSLIHVLEHCPDMLEMLSLCEKRADYLYVNVPIELNCFYVMRRGVIGSQYRRYGHLHFFDEEFFLSWLDQNGFEIVAVVYSEDYAVRKGGIAYNGVRLLRKLMKTMLGYSVATWLLGGFSLGVLIKSRVRCDNSDKVIEQEPTK